MTVVDRHQEMGVAREEFDLQVARVCAVLAARYEACSPLVIDSVVRDALERTSGDRIGTYRFLFIERIADDSMRALDDQ